MWYHKGEPIVEEDEDTPDISDNEKTQEEEIIKPDMTTDIDINTKDLRIYWQGKTINNR